LGVHEGAGEPFLRQEDGSRHVGTCDRMTIMAETERSRTLAAYHERLDELRRYL
jgi:hypothetical protein